MDFFDISIVRIISEDERKRIIVVNMETDFYGGKEITTVGFLKADWKCVKQRMQYPDRIAIPASMFDYFESMSDDEFAQKHYSAKLSDFTDEEIVNEFNKRLNDTLFHHIRFVGQATVERR